MDFWQTIIIALAGSLVGGGLVAFLTYYLGFRQFIKQRERDNLYKAYIENGIDKTIRRLDKISFWAYFNYSKALEFLKFFVIARPEEMDEIDKEALEAVRSKMQQMPIAPESSIYLVQQILGAGPIITEWTVKTLANFLNFNDYIVTRLPLEIKKYVKYEKDTTENRKKFYKQLFDDTQSRYDEIGRQENLRVYFIRLKFRIDELGVSSFKAFKKISEDKEIKQILKELEEDYNKIRSDIEKIEINKK